MGIIDSHAHLTFPELHEQVDTVLARCESAGVDQVLTVGTTADDALAAVALAERFERQVRAIVGVHPHEAGKATQDDLNRIAELWAHPLVVAAGEMGLDYHYDFADRSEQRNVFEAQLTAASSGDIPLVIHSRDAFEDTVRLLEGGGWTGRPVVFHCFTGTAGQAEQLAEHGWRISFTGIVTFRNSHELQSIAKDYPRDQLMIETDSPYLSPHPMRHVKPNEPAHLIHTAQFLADLRGVPLAEFTEYTSSNTRSFFGL